MTFPKPTPVLSGDACLFNNEVAGETPVDERGGESIASLDHISQHVLTSANPDSSTTSCEYLKSRWARGVLLGAMGPYPHLMRIGWC